MAGAGRTKVLFVRNLNYDTTEDTVKQKFTHCSDVRILTFADSGRSKGLGFIEFGNAEDAQQAHEDMQSCTIDDRPITLDYAEERNSGGPGKSKVLFVRNLNYDTSEDGIREKFPDASDVRILTYPDGRSKGTGFIEFSNTEDAQKALEDYQGEVINDREINLDYARERRSQGARGGGRGGGRGGYGGRGRDSYGGGSRDSYGSYGGRDSYSRSGGGRRDYGSSRDYSGSRSYGGGSRSGGYGGGSSYSRGGGGSGSGSSWGRGGGGRSDGYGWSDDYGYE